MPYELTLENEWGTEKDFAESEDEALTKIKEWAIEEDTLWKEYDNFDKEDNFLLTVDSTFPTSQYMLKKSKWTLEFKDVIITVEKIS